MSVLNLSAYKFISLGEREALRDLLQTRCDALDLKGTILLAPEGINLFVAGAENKVRAFVTWLHEDARFADITPKESWSHDVPFKKMRVRLKKEIITMKVPEICPEQHRGQSVSPATLKKWLDRGQDDAGRALVLIDTRNRFEVEAGTFVQALDYNIERFSQFPEQITAHRNDYTNKTIVTFCTGGIRCEKAVLFMNQLGMDNVLQLEGGILKYFEEVGGAHWAGNCTVFDNRSAVDPALAPAFEEKLHR